MHSVHISHDALIEDSVVLTSGVTLAGTCTILEGANLGLGTTVHQNTVIGQFSMVAMGSSVVKNVRPFAKYIPGKPLGVNEYAIDKFGFAAEANEIRSYVISGTPPASSRLASMVGKYEYLHAKSGRSEYR
jgi:UDP-N-acetylglucosamine acyltransferase